MLLPVEDKNNLAALSGAANVNELEDFVNDHILKLQFISSELICVYFLDLYAIDLAAVGLKSLKIIHLKKQLVK